ncbi:hypothetical protein [Methylobacterium sp. J-070]|nr:hypothetical protein [Methylobacterium sp. J-070]MCJ2049655.1 hypothetical protein [Methylobacterium sp. J-070]
MPETVLPEVAAETQPEALPEADILTWRGRCNAAAGSFLIDLLEQA